MGLLLPMRVATIALFITTILSRKVFAAFKKVKKSNTNLVKDAKGQKPLMSSLASRLPFF